MKKKFDGERYRKTHANMRARQRYGLSMSKEDYAQIVALIVQGKAELIERAGFKAKYKVAYKARTLEVVYDEVLRRIVTFLPPPGHPHNAATRDI